MLPQCYLRGAETPLYYFGTPVCLECVEEDEEQVLEAIAQRHSACSRYEETHVHSLKSCLKMPEAPDRTPWRIGGSAGGRRARLGWRGSCLPVS
jgi:hypothetical protein